MDGYHALMFFCIWWLSGMLGFAFWYKKDFPTLELGLFFLTGVLGPGSYLVGYSIHGYPKGRDFFGNDK